MQPNHTEVRPQTPTAYPVTSGHRSRERRLSMPKLRQVTAAIALVVSLGLIVPGSLGGSVLADIKPPPHENPQSVDTIFECDLDGNGSYETPYELVSTFGARMWQDQNSNTIIVQRLRVDVLDSFYTVLDDPTGTAVDFADPDVYWFDGPQDYPNGKPKGWQTVRCTEIVEYGYSPFLDETTPEFNEEHGLSFVQTDECEVFGDLEDPSEVDDCVTYLVTETNLYDVTISGSKGNKAGAATADDVPSADRQVKAKKQGKHRGKGKRGR
jgi:hypothetical protein